MYITKEQMEALIETSFYNGAISHNKWSGQRDTCWSNVKDDMKEESEAMLYPITICVPANGCGTIPSREIKTRARHINGKYEIERYI